MELVEKIADKIVPWAIIVIIVAGFTMYMDVQALKAIAKDYKIRADRVHEEHKIEIRANREALIKAGSR